MHSDKNKENAVQKYTIRRASVATLGLERMWAKRSTAAASSSSSSTSAATAAAAPPRPPPRAASTGAADADVAWILRAAERKRLKAKALKRSVSTTAGTGAVASHSLSPPAPNTAAASTPSTASRKRPLSAGASVGVERKRPVTSSSSTSKTTQSWKQRQQAWNAPMRTAIPTRDHAQATARTAASSESFDQVFLEVFGRQDHERAQRQWATDQLEPGALRDTLRPTDAATGSRDSTTASVLPSSLAPTTTSTARPTTSEWGFQSTTSAPVIPVDDFELQTATTAATAATAATATGAASEFARWKDANASRTVSDNFVKLHMRKRVKGSSGKARKRPAYLRATPSDDPSDNLNTHDAFMDPLAVHARAQQASVVSGSSSTSGGMMHDGLDFLEECVEVLARAEAERAADSVDRQAVATSDRTATTTDEVPPPRCHHALLTTTVAVKKKNKNHGRSFYACPLRADEGRCDFFLWADNHAQLALQTLFDTSEPLNDTSDTVAPAVVPLDLSQPLATQTDALVTNLRLVFGHARFRPGQEWAITRVFARQHTLLVLPTGAGKSLCYQFPALFLPGVTLVISPLIALMNDQFTSLPPVLQARSACLTTSSKTEYAAFVRDLLSGRLKLVFLSPERAVSRGFQQLLVLIQHRLSLVCVDEAHCISEWSHHFRPSYLRLRTVFQYAPCVLAITATASARVVTDVLAQLSNQNDKNDSDRTSMVLQMPWQRDNLSLRVHRVRSNDERLAHLVRFLSLSSSASSTGATILYVHQQRHAEDLAAVLKEQLPGPTWARRIAYYHARMDADAKEKVRTGFVSGRLRVVIATIAFGMGIDKQNVRCVVHVHLPSSVENYLQQVGRAGRDGKPATGLLYLLPDDVRTFRSLAFSNAFHADQLRGLLTRIVFADSDSDSPDETLRHTSHIVAVREIDRDDTRVHVSLDVAWLETHVNMKAATIETFLTLFAVATDKSDRSPLLRVQLQPSCMATCVLHVVEKKLRDAPAESTLQRIVRALQTATVSQTPQCRHGRIDKETNGYLSTFVIEFHVREMATLLFSTESPVLPTAAVTGAAAADSVCERRLLQHVRAMQQDGQIQRFSLERLAFQLDLTWHSNNVDAATKRALVTTYTDQLYAKHEQLEAMDVGRLTRLYGALNAASLESPRQDKDNETKDAVAERAAVLEERLVQYFAHESVAPQDEALMKTLLEPLTPSAIDAIEQDVRTLVRLPVFEEAPDDDGDDGDDWGDVARTGGGRGRGGSMGKKTKSAMKTSKQLTAAMRHEMAATRWTSYSVAKVFHGLASPCFPLVRWRDHSCWKKYEGFAFEQLVRIAEKVLAEDLGDLEDKEQ